MSVGLHLWSEAGKARHFVETLPTEQKAQCHANPLEFSR
jgi:hypothetical protein